MTNGGPSPMAVNGSVSPSTQRRNQEVVHEDKVTKGFDHRPLTVDAVMFAVLGHAPDSYGGRRPVVAQSSPSRRPVVAELPPGLSQVGRLVGTDQQPDRVA